MQGLGQLQAQTSQIPGIQAGTGQLVTSSAQLSNGLGQLNSQISPFTGGISRLNRGAWSIGTAVVVALNTGACSVASGSVQVNVGVQ